MREPVKILYIHGLNGHENGNASNLVKKALTTKGINFKLEAPQFPVTDPAEMKGLLPELSKEYDILIASSLGAFYTMQQAGKFKILINPALPENIKALNDPSVSEATLAEISNQKDWFFGQCLDDEFDFETYFIFGDEDDLAPNSEFFKDEYHEKGRINHIKMGHKMDESGAEKVAELVKELIDNPPKYVDRLEKVIEDAINR